MNLVPIVSLILLIFNLLFPLVRTSYNQPTNNAEKNTNHYR